MANIIKQVRYFSEGDSHNSCLPDGKTLISKTNLCSGENNIFLDTIPIIKLGINTLPGTKFTINGNLADESIVGITGVYELDLTDSSGSINKLSFNSNSLKIINDRPNGYLIIDYIYVDESGGDS